jgi:hypothetical protein
MSEPAKRKLTVTKRDQISSGKGPHGDWTMWKLKANDEHGQPVNAQLLSFDDVKVGELVNYEVERKVHDQYGEQYWLKAPRSRGAALGPKVDELRERVEQLEARVDRLETGSPNGQPQSQAKTASASQRWGDDAPF